MCGELDPVFMEPKRRSLFLKEDFAEEQEYSEDTARSADIEIKQIITESYYRVKKMLMESKPFLENIARLLLDKEVMEGEEVRQILNKNKYKI